MSSLIEKYEYNGFDAIYAPNTIKLEENSQFPEAEKKLKHEEINKNLKKPRMKKKKGLTNKEIHTRLKRKRYIQPRDYSRTKEEYVKKIASKTLKIHLKKFKNGGILS